MLFIAEERRRPTGEDTETSVGEAATSVPVLVVRSALAAAAGELLSSPMLSLYLLLPVGETPFRSLKPAEKPLPAGEVSDSATSSAINDWRRPPNFWMLAEMALFTTPDSRICR